MTQASFLQKKSNVAKWFFDFFNAGIAQCRQKLDIILVIKLFIVEVKKMYFTKKCGPKLIFFNEKKVKKIQMFFDIEN